ncbi:MAG TPA: ABC transporter ATP-binding protein [Thermomicrobiales bacterium]|nr:ABC transporter ATP-binding protein [Thermomicrobiales bacterium]
MGLNIHQVSKSFGAFKAVDEVSFEVTPGRIFGFLGTNGAGKTTTMRMILDIIRPDAGAITVDGTPTAEIPRNRFGYLPEERGLYPKMRVEDQLLFLAQLYGADVQQARRTLDEWLERLNIVENRHKPVDQLSKGNQQKIQFLAAIIHDPDILILDEPFSGLDPVNADQMKQAFLEMRDRGKTIIFSTHQLDDAQELCHEVVIINRGKLLVSGDVLAVRKSMDRQVVRLSIANDVPVGWLTDLPGVSLDRHRGDVLELQVSDTGAAQVILAEAVRRHLVVTRFDIDYPSLNDVFLELVRGSTPLAAREPGVVVEQGA